VETRQSRWFNASDSGVLAGLPSAFARSRGAMLKIKSVEPFILHVPVTGSQIADSTHSITHWGVVGARIDTEDGLAGFGFTGTHAWLPGDQLITQCITTCHAPLLMGEDAADVQRLHHDAVSGRDRHCTLGPEGQAGRRAVVEAAGRPGARQGEGLQHRHRLAKHR
jgi:L-alanine-DL-glutamate epimerase-like enolase superfamily enzyme